MIAKIQKWGNSLGLRIPKALAEQAAVGEGAKVDISVDNGRLVISAVRDPDHDLDELLARITPENLHGEVTTGAPRGREVW